MHGIVYVIDTVMTEHIVDVREGQHSDGFDRYPFEEMEDQSLSILVQGEKQSRPIIFLAFFAYSYIYPCMINNKIYC